MRDDFSAIWSFLAALIGLAVFLALMWWIARANAYWWRKVSYYAGKRTSPPIGRKIPETLVITGRPKSNAPAGYRQYAGAILALHKDGLALDQIPPFNVYCPSLFLPFADMEIRETDWMLWPDACAIRMRGCPDADIIVARRVIAWIRQRIDASPFGLGV